MGITFRRRCRIGFAILGRMRLKSSAPTPRRTS